MSLNPTSLIGRIFQNFGWLAISLVLTTFPHELAHALTARALGWRVMRIIIGTGRVVGRFEFIGFGWEWRILPLSGVTLIAPRALRWFRTKQFMIVLAGPMTNGLMAAGTLIAARQLGWDFRPLSFSNGVEIFFLSNVIVMITNLWPHQIKSTVIPTASDGKQLIDTFLQTEQHRADRHAARFAMEGLLCREKRDFAAAQSWYEQGLAIYPNHLLILNCLGINQLDLGHYEAARATFLNLLERQPTPGLMHYLLMNNVAYADALSGNPELLDEALKFSQQAMDGAAWQPAVVGTRGAVLVAAGQLEEGIELLQQSFRKTEDNLGKAENACLIAIAEHRRHQHAEACHYLNLARKFDPKCPLLSRAEKVIGSSA
ncbi:MAG: site-2 protease family protein [Verrucomicrobiota bacterium]